MQNRIVSRFLFSLDPLRWTAQNFALVFPFPLQISLFVAFSGVFSWNCGPCCSWVLRYFGLVVRYSMNVTLLSPHATKQEQGYRPSSRGSFDSKHPAVAAAANAAAAQSRHFWEQNVEQVLVLKISCQWSFLRVVSRSTQSGGTVLSVTIACDIVCQNAMPLSSSSVLHGSNGGEHCMSGFTTFSPSCDESSIQYGRQIEWTSSIEYKLLPIVRCEDVVQHLKWNHFSSCVSLNGSKVHQPVVSILTMLKSTGCCGGFDIFRYLSGRFLGSFLNFA